LCVFSNYTLELVDSIKHYANVVIKNEKPTIWGQNLSLFRVRARIFRFTGSEYARIIVPFQRFFGLDWTAFRNKCL